MSRGCEASSLPHTLHLSQNLAQKDPAGLPLSCLMFPVDITAVLISTCRPTSSRVTAGASGRLAGLFRVNVHIPAFCSKLNVCPLGSERKSSHLHRVN